MKEVTDRQQEMLDCISAFILKHGHAPTIREIGDAVGISSPNGVVCHLAALSKKGLLTGFANGENKSRSVLPAVIKLSSDTKFSVGRCQDRSVLLTLGAFTFSLTGAQSWWLLNEAKKGVYL